MKKSSVIWKMPSDEFAELVKNKTSFTQILQHFGFKNKGGNHRTLKNRLKEEKINVDHLYNNFRNRHAQRISMPDLSSVMTVDSGYSRGSLKRRLLKNGMLKNKCYECGLTPEWNNKILVLVLDHINGVSNDHRLKNLRMLCPNCNSQQITFSGRNDRKVVTQYFCKCGKSKGRYSKQCKMCAKIFQRTRNRPSKDILVKDVEKLGYCGTGRKYKVSDNAIRKWLKTDGS